MTAAGTAVPAGHRAARGTAARARRTSDSRSAVVLACRGLRARTGSHAIGPLAFSVRAGEAFGLVGGSGSGKSVIVRVACGLVRPDGGDVRVLGRRADTLAGAGLAETVGYVPSCAVAMPALTVADNLRFWARLTGLAPGVRAARVAEALALTGLEADAAAVLASRPLGVRRRLSVAVALLHRPRLLVLDDPLAGVDERNREGLTAAIGRARDAGAAVLYATAEADEAARLCDRAGLLVDGALHSLP